MRMALMVSSTTAQRHQLLGRCARAMLCQMMWADDNAAVRCYCFPASQQPARVSGVLAPLIAVLDKVLGRQSKALQRMNEC